MLRRSPLPRGTRRLETRTPLVARTPLVRRVPLASRVVAITGRKRTTGPVRDVVDAILERASWLCERCNGGLGPVRGTDWHVHHRRPRAAGGSRREDTNSPANCVILCPDCHADVESHRATAQTEGWLVPQTSDPATVAILIDRGARWVYLATDGTYQTNPPNGSEN